MSSWRTIAIYTGIAAGVLITGLFVKNVINEKKAKVITKEEVVKVLKFLRKEKYGLYKQVATFAINISSQTRGNINTQAIEQFINGPQCPFHFEKDSEKIFIKICEENGVDVEDFRNSLEKYERDPEIGELREKQLLDYKGALNGKLPIFQIRVPAKLTKEKFYELQNQITKKSYIQQVRIFKIMGKHTELQIQQNPSLLTEVGNLDNQNQEMLREQGLDTDFEPALAVYEAAILKFRGDRDFQQKINQIQAGYKQILMRYIQRIQQRSITDTQLNQMQQQIIYYQPI